MKKILLIPICIFSIYFLQSCENENDSTSEKDEVYELIASEEFQEFEIAARSFSEKFVNNFNSLSVEEQEKASLLFENIVATGTISEQEYEMFKNIMDMNVSEEAKKIETLRANLLLKSDMEGVNRKDLMIALKKYDARGGISLLKTSGESNWGSNDDKYEACIEACAATFYLSLIGCSCIAHPAGVCVCLVAATYAQSQCIKAC